MNTFFSRHRPALALAGLALTGLGLLAGLRPSAPTAQAAPPARRAAPPSVFTNPVIDANFPDPALLHDGGAFYAYATNSGQTMPCRRSADLVHWTLLPDAMPALPAWVRPGRTWAPVVRSLGPRRGYVAYFTAWDRTADTQAIGVATSSRPNGPFVSASDAPLVAQPTLGGCIDPSCFVSADGSRYLVWKNDGNSRGQDTWLWIQLLSADGRHLVGTPTRTIKQDQPWEGNLVEAPVLWAHGGKYYLFYSASDYGGCRYAIGYAVASSLRGPYIKPRSGPWVSSGPGVCGPGGEDLIVGPGGRTWLAYHSWEKGPGSYRSMSLDQVLWDKNGPKLQGPTRTPQPVPGLP